VMVVVAVTTTITTTTTTKVTVIVGHSIPLVAHHLAHNVDQSTGEGTREVGVLVIVTVVVIVVVVVDLYPPKVRIRTVRVGVVVGVTVKNPN
jgi:hypothetical protein